MKNQKLVEQCEFFANNVCRKYSNYQKLWRHTCFVRDCALKLSELEKANSQVVEIASLFHDVGKTVNDSNHHIESAKIAEDFLNSLAYDQTEKELVIKCILKHRSRFSIEKDNEVEVKIIQSSDMLSRLFDEEYFQNILDGGTEVISYWHKRTLMKINLESALDLAADKIKRMKELL